MPRGLGGQLKSVSCSIIVHSVEIVHSIRKLSRLSTKSLIRDSRCLSGCESDRIAQPKSVFVNLVGRSHLIVVVSRSNGCPEKSRFRY